MGEASYSVEQLIAGSYVKYIKLSELISYSFAGSDCATINLYIDLNSVLKQMYSGDIWTYRSSGRFEIAAGIINMCGHYREFFRSLGVSSTIYLIYGLNCPDANNTYVNGYNSKFINAYMKKPDITSTISENLQIVSLLCQFLPKIYYFDIGNCEVSSMVDYLINNIKSDPNVKVENIVISKDVLMLQLIPEHNVRVIRPLKTKDGDASFIVDNSNLWTAYITQYRKGKMPTVQIGGNFLQNVLCMTTVPERSMFSIFNTNKVFHIIDIGVKNGFLNPNQFYTQSTMNTVLSAMDIPCNPTELDMRFRAINTHYQSTFVIPMEKPMFRRLRLVDLEDIQSLKEIIAKYFDKNPIDIDRL